MWFWFKWWLGSLWTAPLEMKAPNPWSSPILTYLDISSQLFFDVSPKVCDLRHPPMLRKSHLKADQSGVWQVTRHTRSQVGRDWHVLVEVLTHQGEHRLVEQQACVRFWCDENEGVDVEILTKIPWYLCIVVDVAYLGFGLGSLVIRWFSTAAVEGFNHWNIQCWCFDHQCEMALSWGVT